MSTNCINTAEDSDMGECEGEKVVTMMDVLQEQEEFEEDANAVLGASDDKNCTYSKGYIKRQAVYACLTCCSDAKIDPTKRAGVCLACSLNCHENHELIELYTRRNFRCDCGNPKFKSHPCQFTQNKTDLNEDNKYNQNFIGVYCTCHRPYPDPDAISEDEMIQCSICEDWLHASHLEATLPSNDQYSEMICKACMEINEFLHDYSYLAVNLDVGDVDVSLNESEAIESNLDENNEKVTNGSLRLSMGKKETEKSENIDITMEDSEKNENSSHTTNLEESNSFINDSATKSNGDIDNEKEETLEKENICKSKKVDLDIKNDTLDEITNGAEDILNTNEPAALNNGTLHTSEEVSESMETEEKQESEQNNTDNIPETESEVTNCDTNVENKSKMNLEKISNLDENNTGDSDKSKTREELSSTENETVLKDEKITECIIKELNSRTDKFELNDSNSKSTDEQLQNIEECETSVVPENNKKDPYESAEVESKANTALKNLDISDSETRTEKMDEETDKTDLLESTEVESQAGTALNKLDPSEPETKTENQSTEKIDEETEKADLLEPTEVESKADIALKNVECSKPEIKTENQSTEKNYEETDKKKLLECTEVGSKADTALNNLKDSESTTKIEKQPTEKMDEETEKTDPLKSAEPGIKVDTRLNNLEGSGLGAKTEDQTTEKINNDTNKKDNFEPTDTTLKCEPRAEIENQSSEKIDENISEEKSQESIDPSDTLENATRELLELTSDIMDESEEDLLLEGKDTSDTDKELNSEELSETYISVETDKNEKADIEIKDVEIGECKTSNNALEVEEKSTLNNEHKRKLCEEANENAEVKKARLEENKCLRPRGARKVYNGATFWPSEFRQKLCTCNECLSMYKDLRLLYLLDPEDTMTAYETLGKQKIDGTPTTQYEKGLQALSSLDRVQQINALTEYNIMRDKLLDFLKSFKERKEIVKEEDIKAFFAGMKPRREPDGVYFCR